MIPRYLVTAQNNKEFLFRSPKRKNIFHYGEEMPVTVGVYKTLCGLTIDLSVDGNNELPTSPDGNEYRCCIKCLEIRNARN